MQKKRLLGFCPKCMQIHSLQKHHCFPKRFFKRNNTTQVLYLCDNCHKKIEYILPQYRKLTKEEYLDIHTKWLQGKEVIVYPIKEKKFEKFWKNYGRKQFLTEGVR